jgi:DNA modification methylase
MDFKTNSIYCGDCKDVLSHFPDKSVDLIYVDPPFFSNRNYEVIWGDGYELRAFEDRWKGGIENYILWMEPKIRECHRVLKDTGSMYLHCDYHANAHLRILMDRIFEERNFQNEIIWSYGTSSGGRVSGKKLVKGHDMILSYAKEYGKHTYNIQFLPYDKKYVRDWFRYTDENGRKYQKRWRKNKNGKSYVERQYLDESKGKPLSDVLEIPQLYANPQTYKKDRLGKQELLGYPTQKPEALLERIIEASSKPTDIVLDPMCGCGTCISVAHKLGRRWIGIDVSPTACKLMADRMRKLDVSIGENDIIGLPRTLEELKEMKPFEFQNWVCQKLYGRASEKKVGDMGIDGWLIDGRPIQVKQSESIGRNVIDLFETAIRRVKKDRGVVVAFSFGRGAYEEVARARLEDRLDIELKTVERILKEDKFLNGQN